MVVETLLVVAVAALHFPVMAWGSGTDPLVGNAQFFAGDIKGMLPVCFFDIGELAAIVGLKYLWLIPEVGDGFFKEIHGGIAALLHVGIDEALPGSLLNDRVLVELLWDGAGIAGCRDIFHIHLPFHAQVGRRVIGLWLIVLLCGSWPAAAQSATDAVKGAGMPGIAFLGEQLPIKLTDGDMWVAAVVV